MRNNKGFTLIELLVVIGIIVLLSTIGVIALGSTREAARDSRRLSDLRSVQAHLEWYYHEQNAYPVAPAPGIVLGSGATACLNSSGFGARGCPDAYLESIPSDPGDGSYIYVSTDGGSYVISTNLEGSVEGLQGQVQITPAGLQ